MKTFIELYNMAMLRNYPDIIPDVDKGCLVLNLGAGEKQINGAIPMDYPTWDAECQAIPYKGNTVDQIHCYHFLEHIYNLDFVMSEIERVLKPNCHVNICVPYYRSGLQAQDPDHKRAFHEKTWETLFDTSYYKKGKVKPMDIHTNFIIGDCEKNLCLITQLIKR